MPETHRLPPCCDRCLSAANSPQAGRIARRRLLKAAVFRPQEGIRAGRGGG